MAKYRIVEAKTKSARETVLALHTIIFGESAPQIDPSIGFWWIVTLAGEAVGFAGIRTAQSTSDAAYLERSGVTVGHRGHGLQRRLIRVREARARREGWQRIVTDTYYNVPSANNLIRSGYVMFNPPIWWNREGACYWTKMV